MVTPSHAEVGWGWRKEDKTFPQQVHVQLFTLPLITKQGLWSKQLGMTICPSLWNAALPCQLGDTVLEAGMSQCSWWRISCFSCWSGEQRDRHQVFAPEQLQPYSCWAGWAQLTIKSPAPTVPGGSVELISEGCRKRLLSHVLQGTPTQWAKQDQRSGGISPASSLSFDFVGWEQL